MNRKTGTDSHARKLDLVNRKVREINERRRGMKLTSLEDDLDRQELRNYMRFLGVEPGNIRLESLEEERAPKNRIFYAILAIEALIEISVLYYITSLMLTPGASTNEWIMSGMLGLIFVYVAYRMFRDLRK
ncbi:hypothetical protein [Methanocella arvoryzae]|uniref:Uncharacterized protein n=1 Tax=Methanocella arvoryzae (strain DSM 22066 / NBRC 105507 / MRE50) TaxID=351160 RepID=Q0W6P5_METAR|nr:hypothetical protein [Methanocella arvoryzae]CAJ35948.1 hypothetical protein RCIX530 [Methanocella arvoryzae MRE50]